MLNSLSSAYPRVFALGVMLAVACISISVHSLPCWHEARAPAISWPS